MNSIKIISKKWELKKIKNFLSNFLEIIFWIFSVIFLIYFLKFGLWMFLDVGETGLFIRVVGVSWYGFVVLKGYLYFLLFLLILFFWHTKYKKLSINKFWLYIAKQTVQFIKFVLIIFVSSTVGIALFSGAIKFVDLNPYVLIILFGFSFFILVEEIDEKIKSALNKNDK